MFIADIAPQQQQEVDTGSKLSKVSFSIYDPANGYLVSNNTAVYGLLVATFVLSILNALFASKGVKQFTDPLLTILFFLTIAAMLYFSIVRSFVTETTHGELRRRMILTPEYVQIDTLIFPIEKIESIVIRAEDYIGKRHFRSRGDFRPAISNGTDNSFTVKLTNKDQLSVQFRQGRAKEIADAEAILIEYVRKGKFSFLHLIQLLEISGYQNVQRFKKEITEKYKLTI